MQLFSVVSVSSVLHSSDICVWLKSVPRKAQRFHVIHTCLVTKVIQQFLVAATDFSLSPCVGFFSVFAKSMYRPVSDPALQVSTFAPPVPHLFLSDFNSFAWRYLLSVVIDPLYHRLAVTLNLQPNPLGGRERAQVPWVPVFSGSLLERPPPFFFKCTVGCLTGGASSGAEDKRSQDSGGEKHKSQAWEGTGSKFPQCHFRGSLELTKDLAQQGRKPRQDIQDKY